MTDTTKLEEQIAHLNRVVDDLSDIVARQEDEIASLTAKTRMLMERAADQSAQDSGGVYIGDQPPPHY